MIKITPQEFTLFSKYILEISGIALAPGKEYLVETRLHPLLEEQGCKTFTDLYQKIQRDFQKTLEKNVIDAISTNETYFFRDKHPFDLLQHKIIPDLIDKRSRAGKKFGGRTPIRVWSAASSTGQEIYSIAMVLKELGLNLKDYDIHLVGTDISDAAVAQASYGRYNKFEAARGLTPQRLQKYFNRDGEHWRIKDEIRAMASFRKMNLMRPFTGFGKFDIIFCRNVAIYFSPQDRKLLYQKIAGVLETDGYLLIGSTESLSNETALFEPKKYLNSVFYQFRGQP
ncbi:protein-glutamate O-methyltransferase CheR [Desulfobotulus sp. H1]|uniref:protein-glutamate O-methyltransferase n=1 Tax=Desulfobotulus pelophilus TaxID=2823377 RepID=A0ABT3N5H6_9BACT|nr:protein-glutamate O-methyltransferase CheR [Desulfobotulus pelophilus]MCW7752416.1 protein-glutamate O-methyltransferase CheR [Desulfobotulus pelophilus]